MTDASSKTSETVHSELYRDYLISVELHRDSQQADPFGVGLVDRYVPLIDGQNAVYAGLVTQLGDAIVAAKKNIDLLLLHPVSGRTLTKLERALVVVEPTTIEDLG